MAERKPRLSLWTGYVYEYLRSTISRDLLDINLLVSTFTTVVATDTLFFDLECFGGLQRHKPP